MIGSSSSSSRLGRTRACAVRMKQKEPDEGIAWDSGLKDVCKAPDGNTPMWHRIAHKNSVRVNVGDALPDVPVR